MPKYKLTSCASCDNSAPHDQEAGRLNCRLHPPALLAAPMGIMQVWPTMGPDDWCGDHKPTLSGLVGDA